MFPMLHPPGANLSQVALAQAGRVFIQEEPKRPLLHGERDVVFDVLDGQRSLLCRACNLF